MRAASLQKLTQGHRKGGKGRVRVGHWLTGLRAPATCLPTPTSERQTQTPVTQESGNINNGPDIMKKYTTTERSIMSPFIETEGNEYCVPMRVKGLMP